MNATNTLTSDSTNRFNIPGHLLRTLQIPKRTLSDSKSRDQYLYRPEPARFSGLIVCLLGVRKWRRDLQRTIHPRLCDMYGKVWAAYRTYVVNFRTFFAPQAKKTSPVIDPFRYFGMFFAAGEIQGAGTTHIQDHTRTPKVYLGWALRGRRPRAAEDHTSSPSHGAGGGNTPSGPWCASYSTDRPETNNPGPE